MLTSLPLVQDLHHPAMRERHWKMLMAATGKSFAVDARFCLGDLIALELHNYVDACSEIVDRAQKELAIEKQLRRVEDTWRGLALAFAPHQDSDVNAVQVRVKGVGGVWVVSARFCPCLLSSPPLPPSHPLSSAPPPKQQQHTTPPPLNNPLLARSTTP